MNGSWCSTPTAAASVATARVLVNAAGPWIGGVADTIIRQPLARGVRLIKGSHIVVRRQFQHDYGYILEAPDRRVVFVLPFADDFSLIGTTDENFVGDLSAPTPTPHEISLPVRRRQSLFPQMSSRLMRWSGLFPACVRSTTTAPTSRKTSPATTSSFSTVVTARRRLLTVYGGKITTYRRLAEAALARLGRYFGATRRWTAQSTLPGGEFSPDAV